MTKTQICSKCNQEKCLSEFDFRKDNNSYRKDCKECRKLRDRIYYLRNSEIIKTKNKKYLQENNEEINKRRRTKRKLYPWKSILNDIRYRCMNSNSKDYQYYGGRGIKCLITFDDIKKLWFRDKAYDMKRPSIDRKNNDGNYEYSNCEFIEHEQNIVKAHKVAIDQYTTCGKFLTKWNSIKEASLWLNICSSGISAVLTNRRKTAGGYIWKYQKK